MRQGPPNQLYLDLVNQIWQPDDLSIDPFDPHLPATDDDINQTYYRRWDVESALIQPGPVITTGKKGSGKTTLIKRFPFERDQHALVVRIPKAGMDPEPLSGNSALSFAQLPHYIFKAYWKDLQARTKGGKNWPRFANNRPWLEQFCAFYTAFHPPQSTQPNGFLTAIERHQSSANYGASLSLTNRGKLQGLIRFVRYDPSLEERKPFSPLYSNIHILVDDIDALSPVRLDLLFHDIQRLFELDLPHLGINLHANTRILPTLEDIHCVRQGRMSIGQLPNWSKEELRGLLDLRIINYSPSANPETTSSISLDSDHLTLEQRRSLRRLLTERFKEEELNTLCFDLGIRYEDFGSGISTKARNLIEHLEDRNRLSNLVKWGRRNRPDIPWDNLISDTHDPHKPYPWERDIFPYLSPEAHPRFVDHIINGALRSYETDDGEDAPIHALRLARGLLTACAGYWSEFRPPLTVGDLTQLIDRYWETE
jgi:hypothetical protein